MGCFEDGCVDETDPCRTHTSNLPLGITAHPNPGIIGDSHKKLGIQSEIFSFS